MAMRIGGERWFAPWNATVDESRYVLSLLEKLECPTDTFLSAYDAEKQYEISGETIKTKRKQMFSERDVCGLVSVKRSRIKN